MVSIQSKDVEDLCQFLELELPSLDEDVIESMRRHKIDGVTFLQLNEEYLRELAPLLGDRMKLKRIITAGFEAISSQTVESVHKHNLMDKYSPIVDVTPNESIISTEFIEDQSSVDDGSTCLPTDSSLISIQNMSTTTSTPKRALKQLTARVLTPNSSNWAETMKIPVKYSRATNELLHSGGQSSIDDGSMPIDTTKQVPSLKQLPHVPSTQTSSNWAETMKVPVKYSRATNEVLQSGGVLLSSNRNEIVDALATVIMLHTTHPSAKDLEKVAINLVNTHPSVGDRVPGSASHISWKKKLMNKFKNLHRPARARTSGIALDDNASSTKRVKLSDADNTPPTSSALQEYQRHKKKLKDLYCSKKWIYSSLCSLMDETYEIRRNWICTEKPSVLDVFEQFPCLKESSIMFHDLQAITGLIQSRLMKNCDKLLTYARQETKKDVVSLLKVYDSIEEPTEDQTVIFSLSLATSLSTQRGKQRPVIFMPFQGQYIDIDDVLGDIKVNHPIIVGFGDSLISLSDPKIVIEKENVIPMPTFKASIECCLAAYYIFNIKYPSMSKPFCELAEFMIGIGSTNMSKLSMVVQTIINGLLSLD